MATQEEINDSASFALEQVNNGGAQLSMDELYDTWRHQRPDPAEHAENVAANNAAIEDFQNGDRGRPAGEVTKELREELGISTK